MKTDGKVLLPGATLGIMGSGQLGRMLAIAARRMGYRTHVYSPEADSPAESVCDRATVAPYEDTQALQAFARAVDVVTFEFENIPTVSAQVLESETLVRPSPLILHTAQHRGREKAFLKENGFPIVAFRPIPSVAAVRPAVEAVGLPAVLKTAGFGYDGKGQHKVTRLEEAEAIVSANPQEWVLEAWQDFEKEVSVIVARGTDGKLSDWGVIENRHANHILDVSVVPADIADGSEREALKVAREIALKLDLVGLLCVEFFVGRDGSVRVNEMAPRPHNSGHWTLEGSVTSQFEQQVRAVCGLALGATHVVAPTAMANVLGDVWKNGEPNWAAVLGDPFVKWHSYGKAAARPGRKMGHLTALGISPDQAIERVTQARKNLS